MKQAIARYRNVCLSMLMGIGVFLFWYGYYPHALSYQEQYQLFLWTSDYLVERVSVPGGLADWLGEMIVQFYYIEWLGALLLAAVFVMLQQTVWLAAKNRRSVADVSSYLLSFIPSALLLWLLGDPSVLLGYAVALTMAVAVFVLNRTEGRQGLLCDLVVVPIVYWLTGTLAWTYVALRVVGNPRRMLPLAVYMLALQLSAYHWLLTQWPLQTVLLPMQYDRIPLQLPTLMWVIPVVTVIVVMIAWRKPYRWQTPVLVTVLAVLVWQGVSRGYDKDMYELIRQDYLVRNERWDEILKRAGEYQVRTPFWCNCVNLALSQKRLLADRMFDFYQSGEDALIMPRVRDLTSMLPSAEVFWRLGMVNSALRYMFDTQESILNGRKSGRCTKRIAECMIVNGHYKTARKHLHLLKRSLFYRTWAAEAEQLLDNEAAVNTHPVYGRLRQLRYKEDFLYSHYEIYKMLGLLFMNNHSNKMALDYFMGQMLLQGELRGFQQYMGMVQQYGGYREMPIGYQDAMICIQRQGAVPDSPYANYAKRMMAERRENDGNDEAH